MSRTPAYGISDFNKKSSEVYTNELALHVNSHTFTQYPHKHDFYLVLLITKGSGWHEIDFKRYPVKPGSLFLMQPGQMHYWRMNEDIEGYVFFHSGEFYNSGFTLRGIQDYPFFRSFRSSPHISLNRKATNKVKHWMQLLHEEHKGGFNPLRLHALITLVYTEIEKYGISDNETDAGKYHNKFQEFQLLLNQNFIREKLPRFYASELNITEKHLNRIVRELVNKTTTEIIAERIVLEAKRLLMHSNHNITEVSELLGFSDTSYFIRFFKKHTGITPAYFLRNYKAGTTTR